MIEHILKPCYLSLIIILEYPTMSYNFLHKYAHKTFWVNLCKNLNKYEGIISFLRKNFKLEELKDEYLFTIIENGHLKILKILLEKIADIYYCNFSLDCGSTLGNIQSVNFLLEYGANVNTTHDSSLRWASFNGHLKVVELLLEKGANVHAKNNECIRHVSKKGHLKIVKILLQKGANVHAKNDFALSSAYYDGNYKIARLLKINSQNKFLK